MTDDPEEPIDESIRETLKEQFAYWNKILAELNHSSDRVAAIAMVAFLEKTLADAIEKKFIPLSASKYERILRVMVRCQHSAPRSILLLHLGF